MRNSTKRTLREFNYKNLKNQEIMEMSKIQKEIFKNKEVKGEK
jgi:hypothetical protein